MPVTKFSSNQQIKVRIAWQDLTLDKHATDKVQVPSMDLDGSVPLEVGL